ncbi:MAG: hypothetical protein JZU65_24510 [Chlorobium sp.]|nr:hypothetical protein [Chlorobium sp.]
MKRNHFLLFLTILGIIVLNTSTAFSAESATFEAFYKQSGSSIAWISAVVLAFIAAGTVFFTGGTASPIVVTIGTWIGNMMGLSGIAATNAGLALLGGGSIAAGGFGIAGGTLVLTAALSFGTDIVFDSAINDGVDLYHSYKYEKFVEQSKSMSNLRVPVNEEGPKSYKETVIFLKEKIIEDQPISSNQNTETFNEGIERLSSIDDSRFFSKTLSDEDLAKKEALRAVLFFVLNDYHKAKEHANISIQAAQKAKIKRTLPAFIYAASSMSDEKLEKLNFYTINRDYFRYSILAEPDNKLIPAIFSIYLDRVFYRFNDGALDSFALTEIFDVAKEDSIKKHRKEIYAQLFTRYFMLIKLRQQEIASLATTSNKTIRKSSKTLDKVKKSLVEYNSLIKGVDLMVQNMISSPIELKDEDKKNFEHFYSLLNNYKDDEKRLSRLVEELDKFQNHKFSVSVN